MIKKDYPSIIYYDQDFVDIYNKTWVWLQDYWNRNSQKNPFPTPYFAYPERKSIDLFEIFFSSFFLSYYSTYNSKGASPGTLLDLFYAQQEPSGAIPIEISSETGEPIIDPNNPNNLISPLFGWVEYNIFHKVGQKKRIGEIMPYLENYYDWLEKNYLQENGLYAVPPEATRFVSKAREEAYYSIDFNAQQAMNAFYLSELGNILNDKELTFKYRKQFFSLKTQINKLMWDSDINFYVDLDRDGNSCKRKTLAAYWTLLASIPGEDYFQTLLKNLKDPNEFGTENLFPSLPASDPDFSEEGNGYNGSVFPYLTFVVLKGLEQYEQHEFTRECTIHHLYSILDTYSESSDRESRHGFLWEAYAPVGDKPALFENQENRKMYLPSVALSTITLMIENILGFQISFPRKTVDWTIPVMELMGIERLSLRRNSISIANNKTVRGWEIRLESEKLYYFTINLLGDKCKTLPIPSGKCSMLVNKM